ncbi:hypothetical protein FZC84_10705 [Rossellomorea vietnamensis]|uniref:Uncharacterized protein n=1 Tax=Rossellomorea vietnamensis TaxID=218284 RepID=A0A5D4MBJ6_9BACI|nr:MULTISPECIES: hypothetical protein [Bacillaceae]TYR99224.1 hypothetical protein FZC84_10705 [Rossellomorea vietnamensis]
MPTPAQKNFRREMKSLNREGHTWYDTKYTSFKGKKQKWSWGIFLFVIIALFASGLPTRIYYEFQIAHDQKIKNYLQQQEQYFGSASMGLSQLMTQLNEQNSPDMASLMPSIQEANVSIQSSYTALRDIKPPSEFKEMHDISLEILSLKKAAAEYLVAAAQTNNYRHEILTAYITESNLKLSQLTPKMIEGLQKSNLKYVYNSDGSLTYWVQEHGYESVFH